MRTILFCFGRREVVRVFLSTDARPARDRNRVSSCSVWGCRRQSNFRRPLDWTWQWRGGGGGEGVSCFREASCLLRYFLLGGVWESVLLVCWVVLGKRLRYLSSRIIRGHATCIGRRCGAFWHRWRAWWGGSRCFWAYLCFFLPPFHQGEIIVDFPIRRDCLKWTCMFSLFSSRFLRLRTGWFERCHCRGFNPLRVRCHWLMGWKHRVPWPRVNEDWLMDLDAMAAWSVLNVCELGVEVRRERVVPWRMHVGEV